PQNGEIYAMANYPDFDLNDPFTINDEELKMNWDSFTAEEQNNYLNKMWRNTAINDTYEPGSTFKIITSAAGLEEGAVTVNDTFTCNGYHTVGDRMIKCWRYPRNHGTQTFAEGVKNSCNPVFMIIAQRIGAEKFSEYMVKFGFDKKTGIDLAGEAVGIMHKVENMGPVELATTSFGQSFQITPLQLLRAASSIVNGGYLITPHFGLKVVDEQGKVTTTFEPEKGEPIISQETSGIMREVLESVVSEGTGNKAYIAGYRIGGKTATSEKLPRGNGKYIASFMTFVPAENPQVMALVLIDEPQGVYYGGTVAGPIMKELLSNILPYLGIETIYTEAELELEEVKQIAIPNFMGTTVAQSKKLATSLGLEVEIIGEGEVVVNQFPLPNELVNNGSKMLIYVE
ncbi:MAG: penicillin-binding transpeptidase domain-containing protein, partial [Anaerotignaceae bacterium]